MPAMPDTALPAFTTPASAPRWKRWLVFSPPARIVIFIALMIAFSFLFGVLASLLGWHAKLASPLQRAFMDMVMRAVPALLAYLVLVRWVERRTPTELSPRSLIPHGIVGAVAGVLLFSTVVGMLWLSGSYHVTGSNAHADWLAALLVVGWGAGVGEEIMFRGVLFRIAEEGLGSGWALLISALFFGAVHIGNPGATLWSSAAIAIEAGLLFGMLYHLTRSLPLCMGLHAAWNFTQGTIYGIPVSGLKADGWLVSTRSGPDWLSGGVFGAEASVVALSLCSLCTLALLAVALRRGSIVPCRPWQRLRQRFGAAGVFRAS
jgi:uncharacterized protein